MIIFSTATVKPIKIDSEIKLIDKEVTESDRWIRKNIIETEVYDKTILINNEFLKAAKIDINYFKEKFTPNIPYFNKSWWSVGWQVWKPLAIKKILEDLNENDILYYHDSNIQK